MSDELAKRIDQHKARQRVAAEATALQQKEAEDMARRLSEKLPKVMMDLRGAITDANRLFANKGDRRKSDPLLRPDTVRPGQVRS
jgi:hypothetical protein